jgi:hypothetical protein
MLCIVFSFLNRRGDKIHSCVVANTPQILSALNLFTDPILISYRHSQIFLNFGKLLKELLGKGFVLW